MGCSPTITGNSGGLTVPEYSKERRAKVYSEITDKEGNVTAPETVEFLKDYKVLRDQARVK